MRHSIRKLNIPRLLTAVLALMLVLSSVVSVSAADFSGTCNEGISWSLQGGHLKISGNGPMPDYSESKLPPWYSYADSILSIEVGEGITHIGNYSFMKLEKVRAATMGHTVLTIGSFAFYDCNAMERVILSTNLTEIGRSAFERCRSLKAVSLPGSLHTIRSSAFYRCESLLSLVIPASVSTLEQKAFAYCRSLRSATILANIGEVPYWTFYGCYALESVSLSASIKEVGVSAFENCESLTKANYGGSGKEADAVMEQIQTSVPSLNNFQTEQNIINQNHTSTSTSSTTENGTSVTTKDTFFSGQNAVVETQKVTQNNGVTVTVDAILENETGWNDVDEQLTDALVGAANLQDVQVNVYLDPLGKVNGSDLGRFENKDIDISVHTSQGAVWHINGEDLKADQLQGSYDLSYSLRPLTNLTEGQKKVVGSGTAYGLTFHGNVDFNVRVAVPLEQPRNIASIHSEEDGVYKRWQRVVIDDEKKAHFYLGRVNAGVEYLIAIHVPTAMDDQSDVIVPNPKPGVYVPMDFVEQVPHVVSPAISSWGIDVKQLTFIVIGGMVAIGVVVFVIMKLIWKMKLKHGYIPKDEDGFEGK